MTVLSCPLCFLHLVGFSRLRAPIVFAMIRLPTALSYTSGPDKAPDLGSAFSFLHLSSGAYFFLFSLPFGSSQPSSALVLLFLVAFVSASGLFCLAPLPADFLTITLPVTLRTHYEVWGIYSPILVVSNSRIFALPCRYFQMNSVIIH